MKEQVQYNQYAYKRNSEGDKIPLDVDQETGEMKEKNPPFIQLYKKYTPVIRSLIRENALAAEIFIFFLENMDSTNAIMISYKAMEEVFEATRRTLNRAINVLTENKCIDIQKSGNMNVYCINATIAWQKSRTDIKHAKFKAVVYLTETEQVNKVYHAEIKTKR